MATELDDRYEILELLREQRRATVYRVRSKFRGDEFALALYRPYLRNETAVERQVEALRKLEHPTIPALWDMGRTPSLFLVFDLVQGTPLHHLLRSVGRLDLPRALQIMEQIANGLAHAHDRGVVHRALTPQKVLLVDDLGVTRIKISDFDSAVDIGDAGKMLDLGREYGDDSLYLAPELSRGDETPNKSADVYAAGALLYQMLTGRLPFSDTDRKKVLERHARDVPVPPTIVRPELAIPGVGELIDLVVHRSLAKRPGTLPHERYLDGGPFALGIKAIKETLAKRDSETVQRQLGDASMNDSIKGADDVDPCISLERRKTLLALATRLGEHPKVLDAEALSRLIDVRTREAERAAHSGLLDTVRAIAEREQQRAKNVIVDLWWDLAGLQRQTAAAEDLSNRGQLVRQILRLRNRVSVLRSNAHADAESYRAIISSKQQRIATVDRELRLGYQALRVRVDRVLPTIDPDTLELREALTAYEAAWRDVSTTPSGDRSAGR